MLQIEPNLITYEQPIVQTLLPSLSDFTSNFPKINSNGYYEQMTSLSCISQERRISFKNDTSSLIDSVTISVSSADLYSVKFINVAANDSVTFVIPKNTPRSNKHDISVQFSVYINGKDPINLLNYSDLSGYLISDIKCTLNKENKLVIEYVI